jgi:hypothetical protein
MEMSGQLHAPAALTPSERAPGTHWLHNEERHNLNALQNIFLTGFYSPLRTLAFLNGFLDPQTFGRTPWLGDQSNARPLPTQDNTTQHNTTQKDADTSMPRAGFEPAIPMFKRS